MLFGEMSLVDFSIAVELVEGLYAFSESDHDVKHQVPILVAEVDRHLLFGLLRLLLRLLVHQVELDLHLLQLRRRVLALLVPEIPVGVAQVHQAVSAVEKPFEISNDLPIESWL